MLSKCILNQPEKDVQYDTKLIDFIYKTNYRLLMRRAV